VLVVPGKALLLLLYVTEYVNAACAEEAEMIAGRIATVSANDRPRLESLRIWVTNFATVHLHPP